MNNYDVKQINEYTYLLNDADLCTSYLIIGENKALLIDTGEVVTNNLKEEGKKIIKYMNEKDMIIDVSHLNVKSFYDVLEENPKNLCILVETQVK